jgi:hypothetical protein
MTISMLIVGILNFYQLEAQEGFENNASSWDLPTGGYTLGNTNFSFDDLERSIGSATDNDGSQLWVMRDMTGDEIPDLVVYQEKQNGFYRVPISGNSFVWKVMVLMVFRLQPQHGIYQQAVIAWEVPILVSMNWNVVQEVQRIMTGVSCGHCEI